MEPAAEATLYVALIASALVAGGQLFCLLAVIPAFPDWSDETGLFVHQAALSERPHRYLRVLSPLVVAAGIATIAIERSTDAAVILTAVGCALSGFNRVYSHREWPLNHEIDSFGSSPTAEQVERYKQLRRTWDSQHVVRTVSTILALLVFAAAALAT